MPISAETRNNIYKKLVQALRKCSPPMVSKSNAEKQVIELMGNKSVPYGSTKKIIPGMFFAAVMQRKDSVAFHFFPTYYKVDEVKKIAPDLLKCLKGKTCFHFRKEDQVNEKELDALLKYGMKAWKESGYMK